MVSTVDNFHYLEVFSSNESDGVKIDPQDEKKASKPKFAAVISESSDDAEGDGGFNIRAAFATRSSSGKRD